MTLPEGKSVESPQVRSELARIDRQMNQALPGSRVVSYASTGDDTFVSDDGRTTFAVIYPRPDPNSVFGENPQAALGAGIPVKRVRYAALLLSGAFAGLGGVYLSMGYLTLFQADMSAGRGFLALAAVFLGARRPLGTLGAALLFGASTVLATRLGGLDLPTQVVYMVPPVVTLLALVLAGRRATLRKNQGIPHE